ncbi:unnamed protein product [Ranitomeya imitator]|uniref:Uncharacterized protein n=1 Tax=Ranitomeya imitator TaxID=111125 RepID=A0ABN9LGN9_9NEOB|nr:unnamed protein product [Ranitomeya imitator]
MDHAPLIISTVAAVTSCGLLHPIIFFLPQDRGPEVHRVQDPGGRPRRQLHPGPKTSSQSLGLSGPPPLPAVQADPPGKHFVVHVDVSAEDGQTIRISFSNLFKEFRSTTTWLQFPFVCGAVKGSVYDGTAQGARHGLVGPAPSGSRWTCLLLDLRYILSMYLSRRYSHLRSVKLCSNLLVKNLVTSDLGVQPRLKGHSIPALPPEVSYHEARQSKALQNGFAPMPREMAFPVPKGEKWQDLYDFIRFPSDASKLPYDSIQKGETPSPTPGAPPIRSPARQRPRSVTLSKPVQDRVSLIQQITTPRPLPRFAPVQVESIPERHLSVHGRDRGKRPRGGSSVGEENDGGIHVYASRGQNLTVHRHPDPEKASRAHHIPQTSAVICRPLAPCPGGAGAPEDYRKLLPDPILKLKKIIGFEAAQSDVPCGPAVAARWSSPVTLLSWCWMCRAEISASSVGHTDKAKGQSLRRSPEQSATAAGVGPWRLAAPPVASAQTGPLSMVRLCRTPRESVPCIAMCGPTSTPCPPSASHTAELDCAESGPRTRMVVVWDTSRPAVVVRLSSWRRLTQMWIYRL